MAWWMIVVLVVGIAACVAAMLVARRIAPPGGFFVNGQVVPTLYLVSVVAFAIRRAIHDLQGPPRSDGPLAI